MMMGFKCWCIYLLSRGVRKRGKIERIIGEDQIKYKIGSGKEVRKDRRLVDRRVPKKLEDIINYYNDHNYYTKLSSAVFSFLAK